MSITCSEAIAALIDLMDNNSASLTKDSIFDIISRLDIVDNVAPSGATTHLFSGSYTDFAVRGGNAALGKIDSNAINCIKDK